MFQIQVSQMGTLEWKPTLQIQAAAFSRFVFVRQPVFLKSLLPQSSVLGYLIVWFFFFAFFSICFETEFYSVAQANPEPYASFLPQLSKRRDCRSVLSCQLIFSFFFKNLRYIFHDGWYQYSISRIVFACLLASQHFIWASSHLCTTPYLCRNRKIAMAKWPMLEVHQRYPL